MSSGEQIPCQRQELPGEVGSLARAWHASCTRAATVSTQLASFAGRAQRLYRRGPWFHLVCAAISAVCLLQIVQMRFGRDQGIYAMVAATILDGGMPYRDAWDFKPPGIYLIYALAQLVFGRNEWGIRIIEALSLASLWPAFRAISKRLAVDERVGALAAALVVLMEAELEFWHTAQPETFGGVLTIWAIALVLHRQGRGKLLAAGLLLGLASLMKPHFGAGAVVAAVWLALEAKRETGDWTIAWQRGASVLGLAALPALVVVAWFAARGALGELVATLFVFAPGYVATTFHAKELPSLLYNAVVGTACGFSALIPLGVLLGFRSLLAESPLAKSGLALISAMVVPQAIGIALQAKFFPYHHAGLLPLFGLLAAPGLVAAWSFASTRWGLAGRLGAVGCAGFLIAAASSTRDLPESFLKRSVHRLWSVAFDTAEQRERVAERLYTVADVSYGANMEVVRWVVEQTSEDQYVYLWGFEPFVYFAAERRPGSRFIYNVPQRGQWCKGWARPSLMQDLERTRPTVIAVVRHDIFPVVTGDVLDSQTSLQDFPELRALLTTQYQLVNRIQDFDLYRRVEPKGQSEEVEARLP